MADDAPRPSKYTATIDLTSRAQKEERREREEAKREANPQDTLPPVDFDGLPDLSQQAAHVMGWTSLMPVQQQSIPYLLKEKDVMVQSRTGSGKTGAFLLPLFDKLKPEGKYPQAIIVAPTRELAKQVHQEFERMRIATVETNELEAALIYGGVGYGAQNKALEQGAQLVVGTPGRVLDHLERGTLKLGKLRYLILDEADEMLSMGFYPAMQKLLEYLPAKRASFMFSATMPLAVRALAVDFLKNPDFLPIDAGEVAVETLDHRYYLVGPMEKDLALARLIEQENPDSAIVFANTKRDVSYVAKFLRNYGHDAEEISGDLSQSDRERVMAKIREGELRFLVATDVAARGIDISDLSHVFLYDVPEDPEYYVHRTGRTARAGKSGAALTLATNDDEFRVQRIATGYGIEIAKHDLPSEEDLQQRVFDRMTEVLENRLREGKANLQIERAERFVPLAKQLAMEEPELLALLLDDLYHQTLHVAPEKPSVEEAAQEAQAEQQEEEQEEQAEAEQQAEQKQQRGGRKPSRKPRRARQRRGGEDANQGKEPQEGEDQKKDQPESKKDDDNQGGGKKRRGRRRGGRRRGGRRRGGRRGGGKKGDS